jgi:hypothetical protein
MPGLLTFMELVGIIGLLGVNKMNKNFNLSKLNITTTTIFQIEYGY